MSGGGVALEGLANIDAGLAGEHPVEEHEVWGVVSCEGEALGARGGLEREHAGVGDFFADEGADILFVFDNEHSGRHGKEVFEGVEPRLASADGVAWKLANEQWVGLGSKLLWLQLDDALG